MPGFQISAIICTHNRDTYLGAAVDSLLHQDIAAEYEVIVVDNASCDRTRSVVEARLPHPRLRYIHEPVLGLSVARNTGAIAAQSELLAYLDDDAIASPQWLRVLHQTYQENPRLAIAGGKVTLLWSDQEPPRWLSKGLMENLGAYDLGDQMTLITTSGLTPRGVNYSLRRQLWQQMGGFEVSLGRLGKNLLSNEELYMTERCLKLNCQVAYVPEALVMHQVSPERLARAWFLNRSWWQGISECQREQLAGQAGLGQFTRGGERLLRGLYRSLKYLKDPAERFDNLVYAYGQVGYLRKALKDNLILLKKINRF